MRTLDKLKAELETLLADDKIKVDSVTFDKNSGNYNVLSIVLDKVGGIDMDTIVDATNKINPIVDKYNFTDDSYILDVVSKERGRKNGKKK